MSFSYFRSLILAIFACHFAASVGRADLFPCDPSENIMRCQERCERDSGEWKFTQINLTTFECNRIGVSSPTPSGTPSPNDYIHSRQSFNNDNRPGAKPGSNNNNNAATDLTNQDCVEYHDLVQQCLDQTQTAKESTCNYKNNKDVAGFMTTAEGMTNVLSVNTTANIQAACSTMGKVSEMANVALLAFKGSCQVAQAECTDVCGRADNLRKLNPGLAKCEAGDAVAALATAKRDCAKFTSSINDASAQILSIYGTKMNAKQCDQLSAANLQTYCTNNPTDIMCNINKAVDCSNPTYSTTNVVCICRTNPRDPACASTSSGSTAGAGASGSSSGGSNAPALSAAEAASLANASLNSLGGDPGFDGMPGGVGPHGGGGASAGGGGSKGVGRNISGGGDGPAPAAHGKAAAGAGGSGANTKILGGYYGSSGGGGFATGSSGSGSSGGSGAAGYAGGSRTAQQPPVDLRQFLPGGKMDPSRGLAGISGPDGITGPNSDIWFKVNTRYRTLSPSMKP